MGLNALALAALVSVAFLAVAPGKAFAIPCDDKATSTMEMGSCATAAFDAADTELNRLYSAIRSRIGPADRTRLLEAQRAWVSLRDRECAFRTAGGPLSEGTLLPLVYQRCRAEMTEARVAEFRGHLKCLPWDMSCDAR